MQVIESLALFPLSDVVLLPEISVPLYIFEPRYRQMTRQALAGSRRIGMVTVRPEALTGMAGDPPIFDVGCLGRIAHCQERPDGTFQMLLLGERRFRILEEEARTSERLYRSARVELLEDRAPEGPEEEASLGHKRQEILSLLGRLIERAQPDADRASTLEAFGRLPDERIVNALAQSVSFRAVERQQLLQADALLTRFEIMADLLRFRLAELGHPTTRPSSLPN
jgi:Lon protease-like protein